MNSYENDLGIYIEMLLWISTQIPNTKRWKTQIRMQMI